MVKLRVTKTSTPAQLKARSEIQSARRRVASILHILKSEIDSCSNEVSRLGSQEIDTQDSAELKEKGIALRGVSSMIGMLEPDFEDKEYSMTPEPLAEFTKEWMESLARKKK